MFSFGHFQRFCRGAEGRAGVVSVEFALVVPSMVAAMFGVIELARVLFIQGTLFFAAQEATRFATIHYDATVQEIHDFAEGRLDLLDTSQITEFNVQSVLDPDDQTKLVSVEITYAWQPILPIDLGTITLIGHSRGFIVDN